MFCLFLDTDAAGGRPAGCRKVLAHAPSRVRDPLLDDGAPPSGVVQLYFDSLAELEAAAVRAPAGVEVEAMAVHKYSLTGERIRSPDATWCTYLVAYEGPAEDETRWLEDYLAHHPPLMAKLPGIRELEIYTPLEWRCPPHLRHVRHLQRNKVAFDSAEALAAALASPVRSEMRAHFKRLPAFSGRVTHYAMTTRAL